MLLIRKMPPSLWQTVCSSSSYFQTAVLSFLQKRLALIIKFLFFIFTVRSFGTEDREVEKYIAPRDEQFEFIVFRGQDIKDLHVCEAPQQNQERVNAHLPQDPAIVQVFRPYKQWITRIQDETSHALQMQLPFFSLNIRTRLA